MAPACLVPHVRLKPNRHNDHVFKTHVRSRDLFEHTFGDILELRTVPENLVAVDRCPHRQHFRFLPFEIGVGLLNTCQMSPVAII